MYLQKLNEELLWISDDLNNLLMYLQELNEELLWMSDKLNNLLDVSTKIEWKTIMNKGQAQ
jgi:hypothetical protein